MGKNKTAKKTAGYRDLQILVRVPPLGLFLEVQLHLEAIHNLKVSVASKRDGSGRTGHERYVEFRTLKEKAEYEFKSLTLEEYNEERARKAEELEKRQKERERIDNERENDRMEALEEATDIIRE